MLRGSQHFQAVLSLVEILEPYEKPNCLDLYFFTDFNIKETPFNFAALVKESITIEDLTKTLKGRVLTINEVGDAFDLSLKMDKNGACYIVYPDCPPFQMPNPNMPILIAMIAFGHYLGVPLSLETFKVKHVFLSIFMIFLFVCIVLCIMF